MKNPKPLILLGSLFFLSASCGSQPARWGSGAVASSGTGSSVKAFWRAHGNPEAWKRHAAVSFSYSVESLRDSEKTLFAEVAFQLDHYRYLWVRKEGEEKLTRLDLSKMLQWEGSNAMGCALHTLRYLFSVPVASARGRWEFRRLLAPGDVETRGLFEAAPLDSSSAVGPCLLEEDPRTGLLSRLTYFPQHPFALGEPRSVTFDSYVEVGEARIALLRRSSLFKEELGGVQFLNSTEAARKLELPEAGEETPGP